MGNAGLKRWRAAAAGVFAASVGAAQPFPGTVPLDGTNDLADVYLSGLERLLLRETSQLAPARERLWREGLNVCGQRADAWLVERRRELARRLGVRDGMGRRRHAGAVRGGAGPSNR